MLDVQQEGNRMIIDVRERILRGEHPRTEITKAVKEAPVGTVFEIHLPHRAEPLLSALEGMGLNVIVNQLEENHYRMMTVKL
jgi:hypothetical protein